MSDDETGSDSQTTTPPPPPPPTAPAPEAPLGESGLKALQAERERADKAERDLKETKEAAELASKSEKEQLEARVKKAESEAEQARTEALRVKVGATAGLPASLISRLKGDTEEAMKKDAEQIAKDLGDAQGGLGGGPRSNDRDQSSDMNTILRRAAGRES